MTWVQTYTGKAFDVQHPRPELINPVDIAHSLSMLCRFNGHCREFYSVAEHSIRVMDILPDELKPWGLLHDAAEAYIGDMTSPIKQLFPLFNQIEELIMVAVCERFGLVYPMPKEVKHADAVLLATEKRDLMEDEPRDWGPLPEPLEYRIYPLTQYGAKDRFLDAINNLGIV